MARSRSVAAGRQGLFTSSLSVEVDNDGELQIKCRPMFDRELRKILREIKDYAREIVRREHSHKPKRVPRMRRADDPRHSGGTGKLRRSIQVGAIRGINQHRIAGTVSAGSRLAPYARYVHEGTLPHVIRARAGGALAFVHTGRTSTRRVVTGSRRVGEDVNTKGKWHLEPVFGKSSKPLTDRLVLVPYPDTVNHPGYHGDRFLNAAAAIVIGGRYGGRVNLPRRGRV